MHYLEENMSLQYAQTNLHNYYIQESPDLAFLDEVLDMFLSGHVEAAMDLLVPNLHLLYTSTSSSEWESLVNEVLLTHPIRKLIMQDPLTARSFAQPRGYAGDSKLLDMVYFPYKTNLEGVSDLGKRLYRYTTNTSLSRTLCRRIKMIAGYIDETCAANPNARILSVASGHCREAGISKTLMNKAVDRFVALDNDEKSLSVMQRDYGELGLEPKPLSVKEIVKGKMDLGKFDLIYSAGLYDYLGKRFAQKLTERLFDMLAPKGKLMLINISSDYEEIGYLESYMNWSMIGRDKIDTLELAAGLQSNEKAILRLKEVGNINSHYQLLEIERQ